MLEEIIFFAADNVPSLGVIPHFCISSTLAFNTQRIVLDSHRPHTDVVLEEQKARCRRWKGFVSLQYLGPCAPAACSQLIHGAKWGKVILALQGSVGSLLVQLLGALFPLS